MTPRDAELNRATLAELEVQATALIAFLAPREPLVYRRYRHWWPSLPSAQLRVLPG